MYRAVTQDIEVTVEPFYLEERSDPPNGKYMWGYRVTIVNHSDKSVTLVSRSWRITDGGGRVEEVEGKGVVGEQPQIGPGDSYQYSSGCHLSTSSGIMVGSYLMHAADGTAFHAAIPAFSLDQTGQPRSVN